MCYLHSLFFAALMLIPTLNILAQKTETIQESPVIEEPPVKEDQVFTIVEQMPVFPGGEDKLKSFLIENMVYPADAKTNDIGGTVYVSFVVNTDGNVINPKVVRGVDALNAEALRVISLMPKWTPGKQNGKVVSVQYIIPVRFIPE